MYKKILVPLDGSTFAEQALSRAGTLAAAHHASIVLVTVHHVPTPNFAPDGVWLDVSGLEAELRTQQQQYLEKIAVELREKFSIVVNVELLDAPITASICAYAQAHDVDLIALTTHGRTGFSRAWLGSVADGIARHSVIPVLMLRPDVNGTSPRPDTIRDGAFNRILVPLDGSQEAELAIHHATALGRASNAHYVLARIVAPVPVVPTNAPSDFIATGLPDDSVATARCLLEARLYLAVQIVALKSNGCVSRFETQVRLASEVAPALIALAESEAVDAIAMTSHGRGASRLFVGSVADKILRGSTAAVLLFHPPPHS